MIPLTDEENKPYDEQKVCYICKKEFSDDDDDDDDDDDGDDDDDNKKYQKVRDHKDFMKIKFDTDDNLLLNKPLKLHLLTIIVRCIFEEDSKSQPQVYLNQCCKSYGSKRHLPQATYKC